MQQERPQEQDPPQEQRLRQGGEQGPKLSEQHQARQRLLLVRQQVRKQPEGQKGVRQLIEQR